MMNMLILPWLSAWPVADVLYAFKTSNLLSGKLIVLALLAMSIAAWSIMVTKGKELKRAALESERFVALFRKEPGPLSLFLKQRKFPESPVFRVYESACLAVGLELDVTAPGVTQPYLRDASAGVARLTGMQIGAIRNAAERSVTDQALLLESRMGFLATAVSASPLLGLLGTVWGVLDAFAAMAVKGMANLSAVAPGISGALLTTVVGLLVALPSSVGYNVLAGRIRNLGVQMDNFTDEFIAELQRHYAHD